MASEGLEMHSGLRVRVPMTSEQSSAWPIIGPETDLSSIQMAPAVSKSAQARLNKSLYLILIFSGFMVVQVLTGTACLVCIVARLWAGWPGLDYRQSSLLDRVRVCPGNHPAYYPTDTGRSFFRRSVQNDVDNWHYTMTRVNRDWRYTAYCHTKAKVYSAPLASVICF
jgi:hypothetical protein